MINTAKRLILTSSVIFCVTLINSAQAADDGIDECNNKSTTYERYECLNTSKSSSLPGSQSLVKLQEIINKLESVKTAVEESSAASSTPAYVPAPASAPKKKNLASKVLSGTKDLFSGDIGGGLAKIGSAFNPFSW